MPKYLIARVHVRWQGGRSEDFHNVELISPTLPGNDQKTKDLLIKKFGCKNIGGVHTPIKRID